MVKVTKLGGDVIYINIDLIEFIENVPDTMITLTTGKKIIIKETAEVVIEEIIKFRKKLYE